ncbi:probable E3 ubiquitin-protein ligase ZFP1 [Mangifera indica]|uniref:probable E3 ubiquitin-protein ligase ZFP1 n=1 Tax=Mangifera indica TaxID=29780 RepID=UPI001CF9E05B|nr:probable E3 ubiquitin-protein ligase ZFP1 [Mangifera indica]XP_044487195.1 probable E3 ubiquitin-protein ligase ZFP1 [Mangifera indica]XP_044487203.1 probable E3 ubiquitin-protein ligase ZFP1 [Mangifera indica]XP_044487211.1 probable E3 ubiquitin-protein ligase ZFP1 [Mangifera indica]XP_044487219.1 probable E3 ubiquitin-protein ligase ZFP1 [Mangifera indica]XP_044487227.1 probable E3 ubiquitin-protein ligase ZFP1 [Mangifera indica]XP_044487234.1 probable E3 ubiquitin-protein ligase ZFP1 [M
MGHRHLLSSSQMFETGPDQNWNHMHTEQPHANMGRVGTAENGSFLYPGENMSLDGVHFTSHWNPAPSSNGYTSSHNSEMPHYQPDGSSPSYDPFLHRSTADGSFYTTPVNYVHHTASNYDQQTLHSSEGGFVGLTTGNGRGPHKRKSPGVPSVCERGSTSRFYNAGSSSDLPLPSEIWQEKPNMDYQSVSWDRSTITPSYRSNALAIRGEGSVRNVRSRPALDLEPNLARAHLSTNPSHSSYSAGLPLESSISMDHSVQNSSASTREWGHNRISSAHGVQVSDPSVYNHETNHSLVGSSVANASVESGAFNHDFILGRNLVAQSFHGNSTQSVRGVRSSYSHQRSAPTFRASSSAMRVGHVGSSDEGMLLVAESYSSGRPRPLSSSAWRPSDRSGRPRILHDRYRSLAEEPSLHERFSSEGFVIVDRSTMYGPRSLVDQHRDLRLDIDNMTYEELLALGERIGYASTGLSDDLISKCLTETIYCSSDQIQEEGTCVICLEEYKDLDDVGTLKTCGHDYHVSCIKKWLSMKNICPICKASVVGNSKKE